MINVLLIEDNERILNSFKEIVNASEKYQVMGAFTNCEDALDYCKSNSPSIILVDIKLPGMNGIEGIKRFRVQNPKSKTIVVSVHEESSYIFNALSSGAIGYLTKNIHSDDLISALDQVANGGSPMSSKIARKLISYFQIPHQEELSLRENDVLRLLAKGKSYATIAEELSLSINTIKTHTRNIYEKLHINKKEDLMQRFVEK